jgi:hypothetical protein
MATQKAARRSRKRRSAGKPPRAVASPRRERAAQTAQRTERTARAQRQARSDPTYGERPASPFGAVPVSEIAILVGALALLVGWLNRSGVTLVVGVVVCALGVVEVTAREHFSGYRSHSTLLAGLVAVAAMTVVGIIVTPHNRLLLLIIAVPAFGATFKVLRDRFTIARQARVRAIPPA